MRKIYKQEKSNNNEAVVPIMKQIKIDKPLLVFGWFLAGIMILGAIGVFAQTIVSDTAITVGGKTVATTDQVGGLVVINATNVANITTSGALVPVYIYNSPALPDKNYLIIDATPLLSDYYFYSCSRNPTFNISINNVQKKYFIWDDTTAASSFPQQTVTGRFTYYEGNSSLLDSPFNITITAAQIGSGSGCGSVGIDSVIVEAG